MKQVALSAVVVALSSFGVSAFAADKQPASSAGGAATLTQIAAQIYGQIQAGYTQANARLQQFDSFLDAYIYSATSPFKPSASTGVESNASANPMLAYPTIMTGVAPVVQAANSAATAKNVLSQIPSNAITYATGKANANAPAYLPWYSLNNNQTPTDALLSQPQTTRANTASEYLNNLTMYLPASDSFLVAPQDQVTAKLNNNFFNYMNYFAPAFGAYNATPVIANGNSALAMARGYPEFLTLSNQPIADDVSWVLSRFNGDDDLSKKLQSTIGDADNNTTYKKFLLQERQFNAARSMVNGMLSQIWVERAPVTGAATPVLNTTANKSDRAVLQNQYFTPGDAKESASPLQMERYVRTHRVNDPSWYQKMSTASPATIAREQLYVSAQLLAAQQQAHEDREKLLMATLLNSQGYVNGSMKTNVDRSAAKLRASLCKALGAKGGKMCSQAGMSTSS